MGGSWTHAFDAHVASVNWLKSELGLEVGGNILFHGGLRDDYWEREEKEAEDERVRAYARIIQVAPTYWVSRDMGQLVSMAVKTMPLTQTLMLEDLPSRHGFLYFEEPMPLLLADERIEPLVFRMISWTTTKDSDEVVFVMWWGKETLRGLRTITDTEPIQLEEQIFRGVECIPGNIYHQRFGEAIESADLKDAEHREEAAYFKAQIYCTLVMMMQRIARTSDQRLPRAFAKRGRRAGLEADAIRLITLRREQIGKPSEIGDDSSPINWSHRWMVEGHWRKQWYPSIKDHRLIYIAPYIKGPEDRPLVVRDTVYGWSR